MSLWKKFFASSSDTYAEEMREQAQSLGATAIDELVSGDVRVITGVLKSVVFRADLRHYGREEGSVPLLEAELFDGTGVVHLRWLGRRWIRGLDPGVSVSVSGRVLVMDGQLVMFNPMYTLLPVGSH